VIVCFDPLPEAEGKVLRDWAHHVGVELLDGELRMVSGQTQDQSRVSKENQNLTNTE
jgi:hypothetical protein